MRSHCRARRKGLGAGIVLATVAVLLAACGASPAEPGGPVVIDFLSYTYGQPNPGGDGLNKLIADFQAANPAITVHAESVPVADALTKLQSDVVAGKAPDVAQIGWSKVNQAAQTLPLRPFQDITTADDWQQTAAGFVPSVLKAAPVSSSGKVLSMPFLMATPALFYNQDLFKAAGLDPDRPPSTMSEVKDAALAIKGKSGVDGAYVSVVDPGKSDALTQSLVNSAGGALVTGNGDVTVDSPPVISALTAMQDLTTSGAQPAVNYESALSAFNSGKLGMFVVTLGAMPTLDKAAKGKFTLGVAPFPGFAGHPARPTFAGSGLSILATDKNKSQAAWKFVQFLTSQQSFELIASKMGYLPLRSAAAPAADPRLAPAIRQLSDLAPYTTFPGKQSNQAVVILQDEAVAPIVLRGADPAETLKSAATKIRSLSR